MLKGVRTVRPEPYNKGCESGDITPGTKKRRRDETNKETGREIRNLFGGLGCDVTMFATIVGFRLDSPRSLCLAIPPGLSLSRPIHFPARFARGMSPVLRVNCFRGSMLHFALNRG